MPRSAAWPRRRAAPGRDERRRLGGRGDGFPDAFIDALLAAHPRTGFPDELVTAFEREASRKPGCAATRLLDTDWPQRMVADSLPG